jgi:PilZ domain-containing protein
MLARSGKERKTLRRFTRRAATLTFGDQELPVNCVIWGLSESGARLAVALPLADLPQHFTLNQFKDESVQRKCEVVWMDKRFVGVKFTDYLL